MKARLAIVDDEISVCRSLGKAFSREGYEVETFLAASPFLERMKTAPFDIVLLDLKLPDQNGLQVLPRIKDIHPESEVIPMTGYGTIENAVQSIKIGAYHYVSKPLKIREILSLAKGAVGIIELRMENRRLREMLKGRNVLKKTVGTSPAMQEVFKLVRKVSAVDCNVLVQGQSGTGKELVAHGIHELSHRQNRPFVSFNCGGFTDELIASELFGYEKGAFTGAHATKIGLLESASSGTVFLDEVSEMPLSMQVKLLHVIQEKRILRVGGIEPIDLDIRIIAASNKDLKHEVVLENFRQDLYFRLNVVTIQLPALTQRLRDIPLLIAHFIEKYSTLFGKTVNGIQPAALEILMNYSFPGNVRELENIIERAVALTENDILNVEDLPHDLRKLEIDTFEGEGLLSLMETERRYIAKVLEKTGNNKTLAAQILNLPKTTLWRKMKKYHLPTNPLPGTSPENE
ncbi:MAG: sigma-54-dependent Fis family transcriptional regulator [Deltaproteobacteria bacterium]|nr:sigma-54-dependent Fis family transcriptional regulator [Deltaproteobacteria bacterium]